MKANLKTSKEGVRTWSRWIGGAALVLALAGLVTPAITNAVVNNGGEMVDEEVIEVEGEAPWNPPNWGGHTGGGAPNGTPSGDSGRRRTGVEVGSSPAREAASRHCPRQDQDGLRRPKSCARAYPGSGVMPSSRTGIPRSSSLAIPAKSATETANTHGTTTTVQASTIISAMGTLERLSFLKDSWVWPPQRSSACRAIGPHGLLRRRLCQRWSLGESYRVRRSSPSPIAARCNPSRRGAETLDRRRHGEFPCSI